MRVETCRNIADLRRLAKRRLPAPMFHFIDGGAEDETALRRNVDAFDEWELLPRHLNDVSSVDLSCRLARRTFRLPIFLAPTGLTKLWHLSAEPAVARAAAERGIMYALSTMGSTTIEDVAEAAPGGSHMFQIYVFKDRGLTEEHVARCREAGYAALCLTVDTVMSGNRERDRLYGMTVPPRPTLRSLASFALSPAWVFDHLRGGPVGPVNVAHRAGNPKAGGPGVAEYVNAQFDRSLTWDDAAWLAERWGGPLFVKGLIAAGDAQRARDAGATGVMISNHGGRQLDGTPAPLDCVKAMRDAVGRDLELVVDGGVRRGTHVLKALAAGADACSIGRAYLYGLAAGGEAGVGHALDIFQDEIERDMVLMGCASLDRLTADHVRRRGEPDPTARSAVPAPQAARLGAAS